MKGEHAFDKSFTIWYHVVAMKIHSSKHSVYLLSCLALCVNWCDRKVWLRCWA